MVRPAGTPWLDAPMFVGVEGGASGRSMLLPELDWLKLWVEVCPPTLGIVGVGPPTPSVENNIPMLPCIKEGLVTLGAEEVLPATLSTEEGPTPFQVGLCGQKTELTSLETTASLPQWPSPRKPWLDSSEKPLQYVDRWTSRLQFQTCRQRQSHRGCQDQGQGDTRHPNRERVEVKTTLNQFVSS